MTNNKKPLFPTGQLLATPRALELEIDLFPCLTQHIKGDWGELNEEEKQENEFSLKNGFRLLSADDTPNGRIWINTE